MKIIPVILCGGAGTRLWPLSRELYPKQLLSLVDDNSLLQNTVTRCSAHPEVEAPILVCNEEHRFLVAEQLREINVNPARIILEPEGRNTAPAVAIAAHEALRGEDDVILVVLPSDHIIKDEDAFIAALTLAISQAEAGHLATFGVVPDRPETGYGYIKKGEPHADAFKVAAFVEKPNKDTAIEYFQSEAYYWNSGMFVFRASQYLAELEEHRPDIAEAIHTAVQHVQQDLDFTRLDEAAFKASPSDSIDYAVMEKTQSAVVVPLDAAWSDVGSWDALWQVSKKDGQANTLIGDVMVSDVSSSYVWADHRFVAVIGLEDIVVVETADAVMVASQAKAQDVKNIVNQLKDTNRQEQVLHRRVYRPWGHYEGMDEGEAFQVKRITVNPGASLSLQLHHHRAEHWVVVTGTATVTIGEKVFEMKSNESCYIPAETQHRLQNLTTTPVELVEVQSGSYLGEDDIVRFQDNYGR